MAIMAATAEITRETKPVRDKQGPQSARLAFRPDLEGLRGIAILLVVGYHVGVPGFGGGYIGVDVFFVLSGYLITGLLWRELETTGRLNLIEFYARRARRLLPAATLVLIVTLMASRFVYAPFEQQGFTGSALATAGYISNVWFARESINYLAPDRAINPFLHTWSLSVEEQFYLIWPMLLAVTVYWGSKSSRVPRIVTTMSILAIVSLGVGVWLTGVAQPLAFFSSATRAWEFAVGGLGALFTTYSANNNSVLTRRLSWIGAAALLGAALVFDQTTVFPGVAALIPVLGTASVLTFQTPSAPTGLTKLLSASLLQWFGRLSYSWYLWHWPVLTMGAAVLRDEGRLVRLGLAGVALSLAWITYRSVEYPIRASRALGVRPGLSLVMAGCLTTASIGVAWNARDRAHHAAESPDQRSFTQARQDNPRVYALGCHLGFLQTDTLPCVFGDPDSQTAIVLFGDSHAAQWFPAFERIAVDRGWRLISLTKSACPAATVERFNPALGRQYVECSRWREDAIDRIITLRPRAVIMANANYVTPAGEKSTGGVSADRWLSGTRETLSRFSKAGVHTLLLRDTPLPGFDVTACLARAAWNPAFFSRSCSFDRATSLNAPEFNAEARAASGLDNVAIGDLTGTICDAATCDPKSRGLVVYRDTNHITTQFATALAPLLAAKLDELVLRTRPTALFPPHSWSGPQPTRLARSPS
jgi:peptidoglycan/LPS O-acetylase OafA/YrhL